METAKKVWNSNEIKGLLETNGLFVARSVVKIWERQTESEKIEGITKKTNGVGFNSPDSFIMSKFAEFYLKTGRLSEKQLAIARKKIMKYTKQITIIANS